MYKGQFFNLFFPFFLANIAARYVSEYVDNHVKKLRLRTDVDKKLASKLFAVCNAKVMFIYTNDIYLGKITTDKVDELRDLYQIHGETRFFKKKLQSSFDEFAALLEKLLNFIASEFTIAEHNKGLLEIHKYEHNPEGYLIYRENRAELEALLSQLDTSAKNCEKNLIKRYPDMVLTKLK